MVKNIKIDICVPTKEKVISLECSSVTKAEELCGLVCRKLNVSQIATTLFALRLQDSHVHLQPNALVENCGDILVLRIRFRVPSLQRLKSLDPVAYNFYFFQVRNDVLENKIPEIIYAKHRDELLGLGIADMYREMLEENKKCEDVEKDYKKYIPREVLKKHSIFTKKPIHTTLSKIHKSGRDAGFVKDQYLKKFNLMAPNYLSEEYNVYLDKSGCQYDVALHVMPFHKEEPGLRIYYKSNKEFEHLCTIDELCFMSTRDDGTIEISRRNGIPVYVKFNKQQEMFSFISVCDGYYRLMVKWTFNLCREVISPTLQRLHDMKCHGPVGGVFSYRKLEEKRNNKPGCYILRQCEKDFDTFFIDVCLKDSVKPETFKIERKKGSYILYDDKEVSQYTSMLQLMQKHNNSEEKIFLQECLPPSEYDKSQALLCEDLGTGGASRIDRDDLDNYLSSSIGPRCIDTKDIFVFKTSRISGSENLSVMYRALWQVVHNKKFPVSMKMLKQDASDDFIKEFIDKAGQWAFLQCSSIVRLYGIILRSPVAMIMEYLPLGALDSHLREKKSSLKVVELVEVASSLATALWHMTEKGIVHGNIRCRKLLVAHHDSAHFLIKLSDPGLHREYDENACHWIPVEFHNNMNLARISPLADVWAFATTLWEIFSYGISPAETNPILTKKSYLMGSRLALPENCPSEIYDIMARCWFANQYKRAKPQEIMRDVNHLHYQVYNSRRNDYATIAPKRINSGSTQSVSSDMTGESSLETAISAMDIEKQYNSMRSSSSSISAANTTITDCLDDTESLDFTVIWSNLNMSPYSASMESVDGMQYVFDCDGSEVVLQGRIGQGHYGEVFKGILEHNDGTEPREVAIKKLKATAQHSLEDFEREIKIMRTLKHPNIVEILSAIDEPEVQLIMEYVQHGSLPTYLKISRQSITVNKLLSYAHDVALGMEYLGTKNIVHRDLAARNILVAADDHVKISDFGLAQVMKGEYYILTTNRDLPLKWYAPESVSSGKFSTRSDVWSYGVTLWEMFSFGDEPPPWGPEPTAQERMSRLPCPKFCPVEIYVHMMLPCWNFVPTERPTFAQLISKCAETRLQCF